MRNAFAAEITELAMHDPRIVLLSGDIGNRLFDRLKDAILTNLMPDIVFCMIIFAH